MSMMGLPLQAHTNVRDVLAPLFCNGRSFSSLIDELSRHFKFEQLLSDAAYNDATGVLEASSESQSTDSEAEVCVASTRTHYLSLSVDPHSEPILCYSRPSCCCLESWQFGSNGRGRTVRLLNRLLLEVLPSTKLLQ